MPYVTTHNFTVQEKPMRTMRYFFAALALASALSLSAFAGDIHTGLDPQPTPTPAPMEGEMTTGLNGTIHTGAPGDMHTGEATADATLAEAVVGLVQGVLALL
jgi:hypothetical protein